MKYVLYLLLFILKTSILYSQSNQEVLAKVGNKVITVEEFKNRYELVPQINRHYFDNFSAREELLFTLIAENLFALEAENLGFDTLKQLQAVYQPLKNMYVRDALYHQEIKDSVFFDVEKFNLGMKLANIKCFVDYVYTKDKNKIFDAYNILSANSNFDSLVALLNGVEYVAEPYEVPYGKMYEHAEKAIFNLNINAITEPIQSPEGWYIFRLLKKVPVSFEDHNKKVSSVKKIVERRIEDSIFNSYWSDFFSNQKVNTDGNLFWYLADKLHEKIVEIKNIEQIKDGDKIGLPDNFASSLSPDSLSKIFIKFKTNPVTLQQFLDEFMFEGFYTTTTDPKIIAGQLNSRVKRQIELELLSNEAYKKGLENLPEVQLSLDIWKDNYLAALYKKYVVRNIPSINEDVKNFLNENSEMIFKDNKVNIIEILTDSLFIIEQALKFQNDENAFREFAKQHTKRKWVKENNGEFGLFSVTQYGDIGKIAESMEIGDVYGPLETSDGYSIFKLIDKRTDTLETTILTDELKKKVQYNRIVDALEEKVIELAGKYNFSYDEKLLKSLNLLNAQMVVYRYMGFGGRITAFPYSTPFYKWKEKLEQIKKDLL